ncbi:hypothetical protein PLICRDRAFT_247959 [Plicaturopsis crispa FD-325 SS-3]|nr:hypothetical protein PLICRDRAFT_247959 [Plicaturopsis crispa FD-325 SS-3]
MSGSRVFVLLSELWLQIFADDYNTSIYDHEALRVWTSPLSSPGHAHLSHCTQCRFHVRRELSSKQPSLQFIGPPSPRDICNDKTQTCVYSAQTR